MNLRDLSRALIEELEARHPVPGDSRAKFSGLAVDDGSAGWLDKHEVPITARQTLDHEFLEEIRRSEAPAIVWRSDSQPAAGVVEELTAAGTGLFVVPTRYPTGRIYSTVFEPDESLLYSHRVVREMLDGGSLEELMERTTRFLGRPVVIEDSVGSLLAESDDSRELAAFLEQNGVQASQPATVEDTYRDRRDRYARLPQGFLSAAVERWRIGDRELSWTPIGGRNPIGYLWFPAAAGLEARDIVTLYWAARVIEAELEKELIRLETELSIRGDFVDDLVNDRYGSVELMLQRARYLGADLSGGAMALIVDIDDFAKYLERRRMKEPAIQELKRRLAEATRLQTRELFKNYLLGPRSDNIILFLAPSENVPAESLSELAGKLTERIQTNVKGLLPDLTVSVGSGRFTPDPAHLPDAYAEAEIALEIGRSILGPSSYATFESTGTYKLLYRVLKQDPEELETFYRETVRPLVAYDSRYGTELVSTLETYLGNDASMAKTAAELFAHRHTVRYRLERIKDLTGLNVDRSEDRERITLGIKAMQLLGHAPSEPSKFTDR